MPVPSGEVDDSRPEAGEMQDKPGASHGARK